MTRPTAKARSAFSCFARESPSGTNSTTVEIIEPIAPRTPVANTYTGIMSSALSLNLRIILARALSKTPVELVTPIRPLIIIRVTNSLPKVL